MGSIQDVAFSGSLLLFSDNVLEVLPPCLFMT